MISLPHDLSSSGDLRFIHDLVDVAASRRPHATSLSDSFGSWTYAELQRMSHAASLWLSDQGVRSGDRVLFRAFPLRETMAVLYGCSRIGAVFVPVAAEMPSYQFASVLHDAEPALVVDELDTVRHALSVTRGRPEGRPPNPRPEDPALFIYTSGSTAHPKAVVCPHRQVLFAAQAIADRLRYQPDDVVYGRLPLSFDYGLYQVFLSCLAGCALVLASPDNDSGMLGAMRTTGTTVVPLVPSLAQMLVRLASRRSPLPDVRVFTNTGEHLSQELAAQLRSRFPGSGIHMMFGTTECKRISIMERDGDLRRPGSVGRPLAGTTVEIVSPEGRPLPHGETGEIVVRGPHLMAGYWKAAEQTARVFRTSPETGEPRLHTGDFGRLDAEGYLYFHGRRDHLFKLRGFRTSTTEIESAALTLPGVRGAVVLPPSSRRDAVLCVVGDLAPEEVRRGVESLLGPARVPPSCRVLAEFPLTPNGKIDRARLALVTTREAP